MNKSDLAPKHDLLSCNPDADNKAKCFVNDTNVRYDFFGASVQFISIKLLPPYTQINEINFSTKGVKVRKEDVEKAWNIPGRCLGKNDIEEALKFDTETNGYFARSLDEFRLLPTGYDDFVCLLENNSFIKYNQYTDKNESGVDIYYLKDVFTRNYEYIFKSKNRFNQAKIEIDKAFQKQPEVISKTASVENRCMGYDNNAKDHFEKMEALVKKSNYSTGSTNKYFEAFVNELCTGKIDDAAQYVSSGDISKIDAESIAKSLGLNFQFKEPSQEAVAFQKAKNKLVDLGSCMACAGNAATYLIQKPESQCGKLVARAIAGDEVAITEVNKFPDYCEWKY